MLAPVLTPHGRLMLQAREDAVSLPEDLAARLEAAFARGSGHGLLLLGAGEVKTELPPALGYWRDFAARYVTALCMLPDVQGRKGPSVPALEAREYESLAAAAPPMTGVEYVSAVVLENLWTELNAALAAELTESGVPLQDFLKSRNAAWNLVGRVHFNLAENRRDEEAPFAFLATYTTRLSSGAKAQHLPLGKALSEYAGAANKSRLLSLLLPVQRATEQCSWLRDMVDTGEIYHPLRWTSAEAYQLLSDLPRLEAAGIIVRVPSAWRANRPPRARVTARVGGEQPSGLGQEALLDFSVDVTLDGEDDAPLTKAEIAQLLASTTGLHFIRGRWIELDREKLQEMLERFQKIESIVSDRGISFAEAARLLSGANVTEDLGNPETADWSQVIAGPWFAETLEKLRHPSEITGVEPGGALRTTLRHYQQDGLQWLHLLSSLGLGACLADDMGLGKTMQILALLLVLKRNGARRTSLLVAPASLLTNWVAEIERFAPDLKAVIAHPSAMKSEDINGLNDQRLSDVDLVITTYGTLTRVPDLLKIPWKLAIVDEAQAIKNPGTRQTRAVKQLRADARIALTGTPVENRIGDLWSIFDFLNPGLLGSAKEFTGFAKRLSEREHNTYGPLRDLVRPYILRRLKTDKTVIADLPDKTEVQAFCHLTRKQAALYQSAVDELSEALDRAEESTEKGIQRKGMILSFLMRFKQICNHPSQWLGDHDWREADSGKFARLREIAEVIGVRQEKVLVFTQFREVTNPLADFLGKVFGHGGLVLHGETPVKERQSLVDRFQEDESIPFFVISLRAGGFGLNLTAASHVIHFDRWWNPAVENQATDRAFRIGQTKNVLVHKFLCRGTVEEKIDALMESKQKLSEDLLKGSAELLLTEMKNDELMRLVSLDLRAVGGSND
jgi:non-specific serine/threonine protein kinase